MPVDLPIVQPALQRERADAARNRERILCTARRLMEADGPEAVSMDRVAAEAGVGKGTLYRRFGDRNGLVRALIEEHERRFPDELIRGAPPLGPGAPADDRLHAFGDTLLALVWDMAPFFVDVEATRGPQQFYKLHLDILLREALGDHPQRDYFGDVLLVSVTGPHVRVQQRKGMSLDDLRAGWHALVDALLTAGARDGAPAVAALA